MNEIVKYHNDLSDLPLRKFNAAELDLLMTICNKCKYQGTNALKFGFEDIKNLADYKAKDERQFIKDLDNTNKKLLELNMRFENEEKIVRFVLFTEFTIDKTNRKLEVKVNEKFSYILNELTSNFTRFELEEFVQLKSSYAKACYRQLKRYRDTGFWSVSIDKFRRILDVPKSYRSSELNAQVLKPIREELCHYFKHLVVEPKYEKKRGCPLKGYEFHFDPEPKWEPLELDHPKKEYKETCFICPECGQPLVEKVVNGSNCWCHIDGYKNDATCRRIFNSVAEIEGYKETPERKNEETDETHDVNQEVSKKGFFKKLFG